MWSFPCWSTRRRRNLRPAVEEGFVDLPGHRILALGGILTRGRNSPSGDLRVLGAGGTGEDPHEQFGE